MILSQVHQDNAGVVNNADYRDAVDKLIHTTDGAPYATSPT